MKAFLKFAVRPVMAGLLCACLIIGGCSKPAAVGTPGYYPGTTTSLLPNYPYPAQTATATSITLTQPLSGQTFCILEVTAASLSTVTFDVKGSQDGGTNYFDIGFAPYTWSMGALAAVATGAVTITTAPKYYAFNVGSMTNMEVVTSGTFTATSVTFTPTCSGNSGPYPLN